MKVLLDTCEFLWLITGDTRLSAKVATVVSDPQNEVFLSVVSFWEISLKYSLGKLPLPEAPVEYVTLQREKHLISALTLDEASVAHLSKLPMLHRDPFDRMLICQAKEHGLVIATADETIRQYSVDLL